MDIENIDPKQPGLMLEWILVDHNDICHLHVTSDHKTGEALSACGKKYSSSDAIFILNNPFKRCPACHKSKFFSIKGTSNA
jgi:hypothetical protein